MTAIINGMTPAEFISALNDNFTEYWGIGGVAEIQSSDNYITAINTNFGETTVILGQRLNLSKFNSFEHTLEDSGDGSNIDTTKWDITNLDPAYVTFEQSRNITNKRTGITTNEKFNAIVMNTLPKGDRVLMYRNQLRSKSSITQGVLSFSLCNFFRTNNWFRIGLTDVNNLNRIELSAYGDNVLRFQIVVNGTAEYVVNSIATDFGQFKIIVSPAGKISAWILTNDAWVQIGETQTYSLGSLFFCLSSEGAYAGLTSIRDVYITSRNFSTIHPNITNPTRAYGEVPDGTTDNITAINAALVTGNVTLQNGIFAISESVKIPSNRTMTLKNAKLWMLNNSLDNIIRNSDFDNGNINIAIKGIGNAVFDSNAANNDDGYETYSELLREDTWDWTKWGANGYHYVNICFTNVVGFEISGVNIFNFPHWNTHLQHAKSGVIKNIFQMYKPLLTPANTDGFDIGWGCNNIDIYNIKSLTDDDFTYTGCHRSDFSLVQQGPARVGDIANINFQDIDIYSTSGRCALFASSEGNKISGIKWSGIKSYSENVHLIFGWPDYYDIDPIKEDMSDFVMDDIEVTVNNLASVIKVNQDCQNIAITNLVNNSGKTDFASEVGLDIENFTLNGVAKP